MDRREKAVRPKSSISNRPYSVSKDEAYARMLQDEEYTATVDDDEEFARQLQLELNVEEQRKMRDSLSVNRPGLRSMTPISQLFSSLVHASRGNSDRPSFGRLGASIDTSDSDDTSDTTDSDADSTVVSISGTQQRPVQTTSTDTSPTTSSTRPARQKKTKVTKRSTRGHHGVRPSETSVTDRPPNGPGLLPRPRGVVRGNRNTRGTGRGTRLLRTQREDDSGVGGGAEARRHAPPSMDPSAVPLSLAINQPELPDGEVEPEVLVLDSGQSESDAGFIHIMRDPVLLLLFLMGRSPHLLVPDDTDPTDYEALWDLAERLGEVKNRGLTDKDMTSLPSKIYRTKTKVTGKNNEESECRVCLNNYTAGDCICTLPCKHEFHKSCIKEWLKRNATCPICRHEIKPNSK